MIENEEIIQTFLSPSNMTEFNYHKYRFNESFKTVATDIQYPQSIDRRMVQSSLIDIHNYLLQIENKIKAAVYERKD